MFRFATLACVLALCLNSVAAEKSILEQEGANFDVKKTQVEYLKVGCKLFTDRDFVLKTRPKELSSTRYILNSFAGSTIVCSKAGVAFGLALFDDYHESQTRAVETYLKDNEWTEAEDVPPFVLFHMNGADRTGRLYWKKINKGDTLTLPSGIVICYRYRQQ